MKRLIKLTESDLKNIVAKVLREQEDNYPIGKNHIAAANQMLAKGPKPDGPGQKYCFTKEFLTQSIANSGYVDINNRPTRFLHKIKPGDTLSSITQKAGGEDVASLNPLCNLKSKDGFRVGDVIQYSLPLPY